ncbi:MAG TPA: MlaD family protein [Thermoanaerobaculia bacterium]|nr:MlaD family protein [Thermoanaerobaculia bacterium]
MTEYRPDDDKTEQENTQARVKTAKWSPWVWVIPAVAILFVGWLVVRYGFFGGGDITVRFVEARGLDRYSPVRFRGAKVGTVQKITIDENLKEVVVRITMDASMSHALNKGTRFWIVEPGLESGGVGGLLSGTYVGIAPGTGDETREFAGQEYPPVLAAPEAGKTIILEDHELGSVTVGAPVLYQGIRVGRVLGTEYDQQREITAVHVFVVQRFADRVRQSTRFYRGGGFSLSLAGGGLSMGDASLSSLLTAPIGFYTPEVMAGEPVAEMTRFELHKSRSVAIAAADGPHMTYLTFFPGPIGGLVPGTPVQMKGVQVGRVREVRLRYIAQTASLETPVVLEIDPRELEFPVTDATTREELRGTMNTALGQMVQKGMRATLATSLVLPGASAVSLEMVAAPGTGRLVVTNDPPIIPAAAEGNGLAGAMAAITDVANTVRGLPLKEIAGHMRSSAARLDQLMNDPVLDQSLQRLDRSLAEVEKVARTAGNNADPIVKSLRNAAESAESTAKTVQTASQNIEPLVQSLRNAASSAEAAAKRAEQLMGTSQKQGYDVAELIKELTRAAEAVRALATYLTENPDAVLKGRRE